MTYCYSPIDSPAFFAINGQCGQPVAHDLQLRGGDLAPNDQIAISAILIQLHTDARLDGNRGWWGDVFNRFAIGSRFWTIADTQSFRLAKLDEMIRAALAPLISQNIIDEILVKTVRTVDGVDAAVDAIKDGRSLFRTVVNG